MDSLYKMASYKLLGITRQGASQLQYEYIVVNKSAQYNLELAEIV